MAFKPIASPQNEQYRLLCRAASEARFRRKHGYMWIEGERLVRDFLLRAAGLTDRWQPAVLVVSESLIDSDLARETSRLCESMACSPTQIALPDTLFGGLSQLVHGPGLGLLVQMPLAEPPPAEPQRALAAIRPAEHLRADEPAALPDVVLLDRVSDPGNLGGILRSAAAAGVRQAWLLKGSAEAHSPKALRAGMGAQFGLVIREELEIDQLDQAMRQLGGQMVLTVAAETPGVTRLHQSTWLNQPSPLVWAMGQEGSGLSCALLDWPNARTVTIDQTDWVESLNVNAAAAVCLFERRRRLLWAD
jgi:TrmH family RNA methyltransferase